MKESKTELHTSSGGCRGIQALILNEGQHEYIVNQIAFQVKRRQRLATSYLETFTVKRRK